MNDLDLRTALQQDADLVGLPSPDLLEQLGQRRRHQRHQRMGMLAAALGVLVIAGGIPVGQSLLARSDGGPASETTVTPTPSVGTDVPPPTSPAAPTTVEPPTATGETTPPTGEPPVTAPETEPSAPLVETVPCPDIPTLEAALPADTPDRTFTMFPRDVPVCSGTWAAAGYLEEGPESGNGVVGIFRYADGSWTLLDRWGTCDGGDVPEVVWQRACNVD